MAVRSVFFAAAAFALIASLVSDGARAEIEGDRFTSDDWHVTLRAPSHWQISERTSYPNVLLWMTHAEPEGRMLLSAEVRGDDGDAEAYAKATSAVLVQLGFTVRAPQRHAATGAYYFDFDNCGDSTDCTGKVFMRQAFLVSGKIGYALTLATPDVHSRGRLLRAFDFALTHIQIDRTGAAAPQPTPPPTPPEPPK